MIKIAFWIKFRTILKKFILFIVYNSISSVFILQMMFLSKDFSVLNKISKKYTSKSHGEVITKVNS